MTPFLWIVFAYVTFRLLFLWFAWNRVEPSWRVLLAVPFGWVFLVPEVVARWKGRPR